MNTTVKLIVTQANRNTGLYSCFGAEHHSYIYANDKSEAVRRSQSTDIYEINLHAVANMQVNIGDYYYDVDLHEVVLAKTIHNEYNMSKVLVSTDTQIPLRGKFPVKFLDEWCKKEWAGASVVMNNDTTMPLMGKTFSSRDVFITAKELSTSSGDVRDLIIKYWTEEVFPIDPSSKEKLKNWLHRNIPGSLDKLNF